MKLTGKQIGITATAGITGMFAGALLISGGIRIQLLSLAGLLALPPVAVGLIVIDTRAQGKVNQAEAKVSDVQRSALLSLWGEDNELKPLKARISI